PSQLPPKNAWEAGHVRAWDAEFGFQVWDLGLGIWDSGFIYCGHAIQAQARITATSKDTAGLPPDKTTGGHPAETANGWWFEPYVDKQRAFAGDAGTQYLPGRRQRQRLHAVSLSGVWLQPRRRGCRPRWAAALRGDAPRRLGRDVDSERRLNK